MNYNIEQYKVFMRKTGLFDMIANCLVNNLGDYALEIETNFYGGGGLKLNEMVGSYKMLSQETDTIDEFTFVWFTDGIGWKSARGNLRETFGVVDTIYSIGDMENGIMYN